MELRSASSTPFTLTDTEEPVRRFNLVEDSTISDVRVN
jgi:hypothetical protein